MEPKIILSLALLTYMVCFLLVFFLLVKNSTKKEKDGSKEVESNGRFTKNAVRLISVGTVIPTLALLALNDLFNKEALVALFGAVLGSIFSSEDPKK